MARRYRVYGQGEWVSSSGNAAVALYNPLDSNKAIYVHSVEVSNVTRSAASAATAYAVFSIVRGVSEGGDLVPVATRDTAVSMPSGIGVYRDAAWTSVGQHMRWVQYKRFSPASSGLGVQFGPRGYVNGRGFNSVWNPPKTTGYEPITIRPGESAGLYCDTLNSSQVYLVNLTIDVVGGTNYNCAEYIRAIADGCGPIVVRNDSASDVVHLMTIGVQEVGTLDTPYFQLCPVLLDPVSLSDTTKRYAVAKFDSDDAAFPGVVLADAATAPANGIPVSYIAEGSTATPKGFNYIGTKDFIGPAWRAMFPEVAGFGATAGTLGARCLTGLNNRRANVLGCGSVEPIVVRPGEAIALCSAAETATAATAVPVSGWSAFDFALTMSVQDLVVPTIALTGLQTGSRVAVVEAGTETLVTIGNESGGEFEYVFESDPGVFVDLNVACPGYVFQTISNVEKLGAVQTIPVEQEADLIYDALTSAAVTFDGATKRIVCDSGTTAITSVGVYSEWVDWTMLSSNLRHYPAFETVGGNDLGGGVSITPYYFLLNSWRVRPQEANHTLTIAGNLTVSGGGDPIVPTLGSYRVLTRIDFALKSETVATSGSSLTAADVWTYGTRTLTGGGSGDWTTTELAQIRYRLGVDGTTDVPVATPNLALSADVGTLLTRLTALRASNLDNLDATVTSRLAGSALTISGGAVDANITAVRGTPVTGSGTEGDPWGP